MAIVTTTRGKDYFSSYILQRIRQNKNFLGCITGQTGSGKSWSALRMGEILDSDFNIQNVCFTPEDFMDLVNEKTKKLKRGSVILYDEIQVTMSNLDYMSIQSKMINYVLQTFRHKGFILLVTSPYFQFINLTARKLFHSRMETISINPKEGYVSIKPFLLQVNQRKGDIYAKYLRVWTNKDGVVPIKILKVSKPSKQLVKDYEEKKTRFTTDLNNSISKDLNKINNPESNKPLTLKQKEVIESLLSGKTIKEISTKLKIDERSVYQHIELSRKKGVDIKPIKEGMKVIGYEVQGYEGF